MFVDPQMAGTRVLLTGAAGFVGRAVARRLVEGKAEVHAVSRSDGPGGEDPAAWHRCALQDRDAVQRLVAETEPDAIVHLGALVNGSPDPSLVLPALHANVLGTVNLLEAARSIVPEARVVVGGTMMEPGPRDEHQVAGSPYAMSKWAASGYARMFHELYDLPTVVLRLHMIYGPGQRDARKLLAHAALSTLRGEAPQLSSGTWETDWIYVEDVVDAILAAAASPGAAGATVDVGTGETATVREVVDTLIDALGGDVRPQWGALPDRPFEHPRSADPATWEPVGWAPATALRDGLGRTAEWFRSEWERSAGWIGHATGASRPAPSSASAASRSA